MIDLIFASYELSTTLIKCGVHEVEHGSDHRANETTFDIAPPERIVDQRLLFKNAPWKAGNDPAAIVAKDMKRSFPIKFGLMVGIGGGVWSKKADIRLGEFEILGYS